MLRMYALIAICLAASCMAQICHWSVLALTAVYMGIGAVWESRRPRHIAFLSPVLCLAFFMALTAFDFVRHIGFIAIFQNIFLNILWSVFAYRILRHERTMDRVQVGVLAIVPLACVAFALPALGFIAFLIPYLVILFSFLAAQALEVPTTGCEAYSRQMYCRHGFHLSGKFFAAIASMGLIAFAAGSFLFLVIPRYDSDVGAAPSTQEKGGVFPDVDLNKTGEIDLDPSLVFRADVPETAEPRYWIIDIYDVFDGEKWHQSKLRRRRLGSEPGTAGRYHVEFVRPWRDRRLPVPAETVHVRAENADPDSEQPVFYPDNFNVWRRKGISGTVTAYAFDLADGLELRRSKYTFDPRSIWPGTARDRYPRIADLAAAITEGSATERERAERIRDYLRQNYRYSLNRPVREGAVVEDFLFEQKIGHCEMFSTAMAVLAASAGLRVGSVNGFASSEYRDGLHLVRAAHAHSWVVVYFKDGSRAFYDPTPSGPAPVDVDWIVRINDWFMTYKTDRFYRWIAQNGFGLVICVLALTAAAGLAFFPVRFVRRRLKPASVIRRETWREFIDACKKMPHTQKLARYTYEEWYLIEENSPVRSFVRANIEARFARDDEPENPVGRFTENHRMIRALGNAVRALRGKHGH